MLLICIVQYGVRMQLNRPRHHPNAVNISHIDSLS